MVRQFASYLRTIDPATEVPPSRLLRAGNRRATPYIYTNSEIAALIDAAAILRYPLLIATYRTLIGLLAVSGLRVGEAIRLDTDDIDWERELLIVRDTKFGKTRLVPLHSTAIEALDDYIRRTAPCVIPVSACNDRTILTAACFSSGEYRRVVGFPAVRSEGMNSVLDFPRPGVSTHPRTVHCVSRPSLGGRAPIRSSDPDRSR
jgi:integrase